MVSNKSLDTFPRDGYIVMDMGDMEIWDGADLALIREMFTRLVDGAKHQNVGIDMSSVKYIPSGFFGLLYDWYERGIGIRLYDAQAHVRDMMWFRQFFVDDGRGCYELTAVTCRENDVEQEDECDSLQEVDMLDLSDSNDQLEVAGLHS
ncbi:hypothetical protein CA54_10460 [Symmachiella macrocystis]|uniref:STAS domain-containing protein n=1 Tax=Symmachiella macrocystis TaxID=2527985 RepID=A0A5C6BJ77_9PLAN|nr:hypothetical protein [Symmachiella macrocystis]TWU12223.1 hypothetical protein CA54_10460 [Symmachiella macrocystis]